MKAERERKNEGAGERKGGKKENAREQRVCACKAERQRENEGAGERKVKKKENASE